MSRKRQNHPDFKRPQFEMGRVAKAGDWYVGPLYAGIRGGRRHPDPGLNYHDGDGWVRLSVVDPTFPA